MIKHMLPISASLNLACIPPTPLPCRHELPTDDKVYERRKEREREEQEERRGAQNACSHNEFLYI